MRENFESNYDVIIYNLFEKLLEENNSLYLDELNRFSSDINTDLEELKERYLWLKKLDINPNFIDLKDNHNKIYTIFDKYNIMLNDNNIEYYYTSGILSYLLVNKNLQRYHHDLDIFINMNDIKILEEICEKYNFSFERKLGKRDNNTQRVMIKMYYNDIPEIPITVFMYIHNTDKSITQMDYFINNGIPYVEYMYNSPEIVKLSFSDNERYHNKIKYYSITLEALYLSKMNNRPKDIYDCEIFKSKISKLKLEQLKHAYEINGNNRTELAKNDLYYNFIFNPIGVKKKTRCFGNDKL